MDERVAVAKYSVTPVDTKSVDTDKAFEGELMQIRSRIVAGEFNSGDRPDLYAGTHPLEALKAFICIAANHCPEFSLMHLDVSRAYFHAKAQRPVLVKLPAEDCSGRTKGKIGLLKKSIVRYQRCSKQLGTRLARALRILELRAGALFQKLVPQQEKENFGFETRRRLCGETGTKGSLLELKKQLESVYPIKASIIGAGSTKSIIQSPESDNMLERERQGYCVNMILDTLTFSLRVCGSRMETQCKLK